MNSAGSSSGTGADVAHTAAYGTGQNGMSSAAEGTRTTSTAILSPSAASASAASSATTTNYTSNNNNDNVSSPPLTLELGIDEYGNTVQQYRIQPGALSPGQQHQQRMGVGVGLSGYTNIASAGVGSATSAGSTAGSIHSLPSPSLYPYGLPLGLPTGIPPPPPLSIPPLSLAGSESSASMSESMGLVYAQMLDSPQHMTAGMGNGRGSGTGSVASQSVPSLSPQQQAAAAAVYGSWGEGYGSPDWVDGAGIYGHGIMGGGAAEYAEVR